MAYPLCPPLFCVPTMTLSRTDLAELAVFAAVAWAKARHDGTVRVAVELVPLQAPQTVQEATQ